MATWFLHADAVWSTGTPWWSHPTDEITATNIASIAVPSYDACFLNGFDLSLDAEPIQTYLSFLGLGGDIATGGGVLTIESGVTVTTCLMYVSCLVENYGALYGSFSLQAAGGDNGNTHTNQTGGYLEYITQGLVPLIGNGGTLSSCSITSAFSGTGILGDSAAIDCYGGAIDLSGFTFNANAPPEIYAMAWNGIELTLPSTLAAYLGIDQLNNVFHCDIYQNGAEIYHSVFHGNFEGDAGIPVYGGVFDGGITGASELRGLIAIAGTDTFDLSDWTVSGDNAGVVFLDSGVHDYYTEPDTDPPPTYVSDASPDMPAVTDVRDEVVFDNDNLKGTLIVPGAASGPATVTRQLSGGYDDNGPCAKFAPTPDETVLYGYWNFYVVVPATDFVLSFMYKSFHTTSAWTGTLKVTFCDNDAPPGEETQLLSSDDVAGTYDETWQKWSSASLSPTSAGLCRVRLEIVDGTDSGGVYIDDIKVEEPA